MTEHTENKTHDNKARLPFTETVVRSHVERNIRYVDKLKTENLAALEEIKCGDGRDASDTVEAIFGATLGYIHAAVATVEEMVGPEALADEEKAFGLFDMVVDEVNPNGIVDVHTDDHVPEDIIAGGCGENKIAHTNPQFGLSPSVVQQLDRYLEAKKNAGKLKQKKYQGPHTEGAVVAVDSEEIGVRANDIEAGTSVFVLSRAKIGQRFNTIATALSTRYSLEHDQVRHTLGEKFKQQTGIVKEALASTLDIYSVTLAPDRTINIQKA